MSLRLIAALLLLSACQLTLPGRGSDTSTVNPITGGAVTVTPLDPGPSEESPAAAVQAQPAPAKTAPAAPSPDPKPAVTAPEPAAQTSLPQQAEPVLEPAVPKSAAQISCEKRKGVWSRAGKTGTMTCVTKLKDSGKQCRRKSDCEGQCLARSRTCAPVAPLFGCNEVLQVDGRRVTLCID